MGRSNTVSPNLLRRQLAQLQRQGSIPVQLDSVASKKRQEVASFAVTFDDGYASLFDLGISALKDCGVRALTYIVAGHLGGSNVWDQRNGDVVRPLMSESQIRTWLREGHSIGSHTLSHSDLTSMNEKVARREIRESKDRLEQMFGVDVCHFCYPYGSWNCKVIEWVRDAGYHTAVTVDQRRVCPLDNLWSLPRWMVYTHRWPRLANLREQLRFRLRSAFASRDKCNG